MKFIKSEFSLDVVINLFPEFWRVVKIEDGYLGFYTIKDYNNWLTND